MTMITRQHRRSLPTTYRLAQLWVCLAMTVFLYADAFSQQQRTVLSRHNNIPKQHSPRISNHLAPSNLLNQASFPGQFPTSTALGVANPLISASDTWGNAAALVGSACLAQWAGSNTKLGRLLGAPVTALALTFFMASTHILAPGGTATSKQLQWLALHLATPLILLGADLDDCWKRCGSLILSFAVAAAATIAGSVVGWRVAGPSLQVALGVKDGLAIAAALMSKNIGGGINYIAVCRALQASPQAIAAGLCMDNLAALVYFPASNAIGSGRPDVEAVRGEDQESSNEEIDNSKASMTVPSVTMAIFASCGLLWLGERFSQRLVNNASAQLPLCTLVATLGILGISALANIGEKEATSQHSPNIFQRLQSQVLRLRPTCNVLGTTALYIFFCTVGAPGSQISVKSSILPLSKFLLCLYGIHGGILWACHKLFWKEDEPNSWRSAFLPQRLLVASSSAIGGPPTSVALAESNGWKSLIVPALLVGNTGYVIATFCGLAYYYGLI